MTLKRNIAERKSKSSITRCAWKYESLANEIKVTSPPGSSCRRSRSPGSRERAAGREGRVTFRMGCCETRPCAPCQSLWFASWANARWYDPAWHRHTPHRRRVSSTNCVSLLTITSDTFLFSKYFFLLHNLLVKIFVMRNLECKQHSWRCELLFYISKIVDCKKMLLKLQVVSIFNKRERNVYSSRSRDRRKL